MRVRRLDGDERRAAHVGASGDAHQILLDVVGLHPASVEYYWRYSESLTELYNVINVSGSGPRSGRPCRRSAWPPRRKRC